MLRTIPSRPRGLLVDECQNDWNLVIAALTNLALPMFVSLSTFHRRESNNASSKIPVLLSVSKYLTRLINFAEFQARS